MLAETTADLPRIEARMFRWMAVLAILGVITLLATLHFQIAIAFAVGACFGILNFHWLWRTGTVLMEIQTGRVPRVTVFLIVLRYPLSFAGLVILYYSGWLSPLPVVAGLLVPGGGVFVESLFLIGVSLRHDQAA